MERIKMKKEKFIFILRWRWNNNSKYIPIFESHLSFLLRQMWKREKKIEICNDNRADCQFVVWMINESHNGHRKRDWKKEKKQNNEFLSNFTCIVHKIQIKGLSSPHKQKRTRIKIKTKRCAVMWKVK